MEHGYALVRCAALPGGHACNHFGAIGYALLGVKRSFPPCNPLHCQTSVLINKYRQGISPYLASATTFCAASFMPSATVNLSPEVRRISWPRSTFVPSSLTTMG